MATLTGAAIRRRAAEDLAEKEEKALEDALPPPTGDLVLGITLPLLVLCMEATKVQKDEASKPEYAYVATFKAVLPEKMAAMLLSAVKDHRLVVTVPGKGSGA